MQDLSNLAEMIARHTDGDGVLATAIPRLSLVRMSKQTEPMQGLQQPALCIIAQGRKQVLLADEMFEYGPARHLIASADLPITGQVVGASPDEPYLSLKLDLDLSVLGAMMLEIRPQPISLVPTKSCGKALCLSNTDPKLLEAALRLVRLLDHPDDIPFLAPLAEREVLYRLLRGDQGEKLRRMLMPDSRLAQVNRAIAWIRQNYDKPFSIDRVAEEARMSTSSLHEHFREVTAMSPLQYQKQLRLQEARRLILSEALDAASAAHRVGYDSPSQFSREYRRLFGAPPIQDVSRLKTGPAAYAPASA
ncbi:transcriptional regulator, AraC family [Rhizobium sp. RU35A]|uniref:AraC family transcriptional regulator n=2 Tax=Rhizobium/Agrobacterium group TaxID=227290 RepID=A0A549TDL2_9HYPH|nr:MULTISPECIES: AraC family transcriptional regulator [Rhizobium]TRL40144.1 AraC family transcriptional regulator [Rhizobium straminoryzae]SIQ20722.1 transcriptional regulator, AraC family [Rhizobium sp. RU35A]